MQGLEDDDDGPEFSGPAPDPADRVWRHPAELAAMRAAADVPTIELPRIDGRQGSAGLMLHRGLLAAAAVVAVGATALAIGALTARSSLDPSPGAVAAPALNDAGSGESDGIGGVALATQPEPEQALAARLYEDLSDSLPRVQAATAAGMVEGSGAFITADGHLITSSRLVTGAEYVLVWTDDGSRWSADLVASDAFSDVALLLVEPDAVARDAFDLATFKPSTELWAGQYAIAVDHEQASMTVGEVSSLVAAAPHDAAGDRASRFDVEPGMAPGAAIVDDSGAIIGLVNASSPSQATPAWMVERVAGDLLTSGSTHHAWLGVQVEPDPGRSVAGVVDVIAGSPADLAGLRHGDVIDAVAQTPISATASLWTLIQRHDPGDRVDLAVTRNGERRLITVELSELPD